VTVTDTGQRAFGFQATARLESNQSGGQAGAFNTVDNTTQILCDDGQTKPAAGCRAGFTVEFIEHTSPSSTGTFTIEWTPPATDVGNVRIYVAGNAANGNGSNTGDRIYTANYTLAPAGTRPTISSGGVAEGFTFQPGVTSSAWTAIFGSNFGTATRTWDGAISGNTLPTSLDGVSVTINNRPATVYFISPTQINVLAPIDDATGDGIEVVVTTSAGASAPMQVKKQAALPGLYAPFAQNNNFYVTAVALDGTLVGKTGVDSRVQRAARPGETILLFGTGFGRTNPEAPTTQVVSGAPGLVTKPTIRIGDTSVEFPGNGNLVAAGLYQFNITVPVGLADGEHVITAETGGIRSGNNVLISVQR
jgi:uncharacterized protein (TIGR03437 family)